MKKSEIKNLSDISFPSGPVADDPELYFKSLIGASGGPVATNSDCCQPDEWEHVLRLNEGLYYAWDGNGEDQGCVYVGEWK
tara:strand:+ start:969 stop:1211 length:243 start_codon:yes stop_codon:yes gene_type:complete